MSIEHLSTPPAWQPPTPEQTFANMRQGLLTSSPCNLDFRGAQRRRDAMDLLALRGQVALLEAIIAVKKSGGAE